MLIKSGYRDYSQTATVYSTQTTYLSVTLPPLISPSTGDLNVFSVPSGASVYMNGEYRGETRADGPLYITAVVPGTYTVTLKKGGYTDYTTTAQVQAGATAEISAALQPGGAAPAIASAEIFSQPSGADVLINNQFIGITPLSLDRVPVDTGKTYTVEIRMTGYQPYTTSGKVTAGQSVVINAALAPLASPTTVTPLPPVVVLTALIGAGVLAVRVRRTE
jgi:hypothetical protein